MSKVLRILPRAAVLAGLALPLACGAVPALAQTAPPLTAEQSASLDRAIRLWTNTPAASGENGGAGAPADYTVTPEDDHYRLDKPLTTRLPGARVQGGALSAAVRPLGGGRWQFDDVKISTPITFSVPARKKPGRVRLLLDIKDQNGRAVIDPSLTTQSTFDASAAGFDGTMTVPARATRTPAAPDDHATPDNSPNPGNSPATAAPAPVSTTFRGGAITSHGVWQPAGPGRVDRTSTTTLDDLAVAIAGKQKVSIAIHTLRGDIAARGLSLDRLAAVTALMRDKLPEAARSKPLATTSPTADRAKLTPEQRQVLHAMLSDVRDIAASLEVDATLDEVAFSAGDHVVRLHKVAVTEGIAAPGGRADIHMRITLEGLASPDIPPAIAQNYLPHRVVIAPRVSGIDADALFDMLGAMIDGAAPTPQETRARAAALLGHGPVSAGLDELAFDIGPTQVSATGSVQIASPNPKNLTGSATIEAKHLNDLIKRANTDPTLHEAAPLLIFLKGIGDEDDTGTVVWKVAYGGGKVLVNGTDLSRLIAHK